MSNKYNLTLENAKFLAQHTQKAFKKTLENRSEINDTDVKARKVACLFFEDMSEVEKIDYANSQLETISFFAQKNENINLISSNDVFERVEKELFLRDEKRTKIVASRESLNKVVRSLRAKKLV